MRSRISGTKEKPRLSVFRSLRSMYVQAIDDVHAVTLISAHSREVEGYGMTKVEEASKLGSLFVKRAEEAGIKSVVFDRGGYAYHGRVKAFAEAARKAGLEF